MKRISEKEGDRQLSAAREELVRDLQAAGADSGKISLANKKFAWAEEAVKAALNHRSVLYTFFDSIPILGKPFAILINSTEKAIAEHGLFLGLAKGLLIGGILAVALVVVSEAVLAGAEVLRQGIQLEYTYPAMSNERVHAVEENNVRRYQRVLHLGRAATTQGSVPYYAFDEMRVKVAIIDDVEAPTWEALQALDQDVLRRGAETLAAGKPVTPFFHYFEASDYYFLHIKTPLSVAAHRDVATLRDPDTNVDYAFATLDGVRLILIPFRDYEDAHLPLHETVE